MVFEIRLLIVADMLMLLMVVVGVAVASCLYLCDVCCVFVLLLCCL